MLFAAKFGFVFSMVLLEFSAARSPAPWINCNAQRRCNTDLNNPVYATSTGNDCLVFQNLCLFQNEYCNRQSKHPCSPVPLHPITREQCLPKCKRACTREFRPICAEFLGRNGTFSNPCTFAAHICTKGEAWRRIADGECGPRIA